MHRHNSFLADKWGKKKKKYLKIIPENFCSFFMVEIIARKRKLMGNGIYPDCENHKFSEELSILSCFYPTHAPTLCLECALWQCRSSFCCSPGRPHPSSLWLLSPIRSCLKTMVYCNLPGITLTTAFTDLWPFDIYKWRQWLLSITSSQVLKKCAQKSTFYCN